MENTVIIVKFDINKVKPEEVGSWCKLYKKETGFKIIPVPNNLDVSLHSTDKAIEFLEIKLEELKNKI